MRWKRGMPIYLRRISDKGKNPKGEWPVGLRMALVRCSCLFLFFSDPIGPQSFWGWSDTLVPGFPWPHSVSPPSTCPALSSNQEMAPGRWLREGDFILHALCSVLERASWWVRSSEQVLRVLNTTKCSVHVFYNNPNKSQIFSNIAHVRFSLLLYLL